MYTSSPPESYVRTYPTLNVLPRSETAVPMLDGRIGEWSKEANILPPFLDLLPPAPLVSPTMSYDIRPEPTPEKSSKLEDRGSFVEQFDPPTSSPKPAAQNLNAKLANPLAGVSHEQLMADATIFASTHGLAEYTETIQKGALVAQDPTAFESLPLLTENDRVALRREITHKWDQPAMLYYLVVMCSIAAAVQGVRASLHGGECVHLVVYPCLYSIDG